MWLPKSLHIRKFRSAWPYLSKGPTYPSEIVEYTKRGKSVRELNIDAGQGGAFGIAILTAPPMPAAAAIRNVKPHQMRWRHAFGSAIFSSWTTVMADVVLSPTPMNVP